MVILNWNRPFDLHGSSKVFQRCESEDIYDTLSCSIVIYLKLELLTQFPALNDEKYLSIYDQ